MPSSREPDTQFHPFTDSFASVMDNLIEGCQIVDPSWRYLYVNDTVVRHARRSREQLLGRTMMEVYPGIDRTSMWPRLRECMEARVSRRMENEFTFPDGSKGWFELRFNPVPEGVFILSLDVTERKRAEAANEHLNAVLLGLRNVNQLITREKDPDRLIRSACDLLVEARGFRSVMIGLTDARGTLTRHAQAGEAITALGDRLRGGEVPACAREAIASGEIVRRRPGQPCDPACPCSAGFALGEDALAIALRHEGRGYGFMILFVPGGLGGDEEEHSLLREAAGDIAFALHAMRIGSEGKQARDDLRQAEEQLRQAQKLEAIGRLAGGVAHDYNNILMVQLGYCDMMLGEIKPGDRFHEEISQIAICAERAAGLSRQLLAFSRKQALQPRVLDLNAVVGETEKMLRRLIGEDIDLVTSLAPDLGRIKGDPGQIEQVIMNLAVNARDAMPHGGKLTIETANVELDETYASAHLNTHAGPHVMIALSDTGHGMDEETRSHLFEPFFTTKEAGKGTGLGLATVYGIVKQSGGNIWVYSEPGSGATFKIYFPRIEALPDSPARSRALPAPGAGELVLVVEDDATLRKLFVKMLASLGFQARVAANGDEALALIASDGLHPDLLIADLVMPGMGGVELARRLTELQPGLRVLFTSGYTDTAIVHQGLLADGAHFLQKPFSRAELSARLREILAPS